MYCCNQCDYQATRQDYLQGHIQSKHKGVKYQCNQCNYQGTQKGILQNIFSLNIKVSSINAISVIIKLQESIVLINIFSQNMKVLSILVISVIIKLQHIVFFRDIYRGINYPCNLCDYQATVKVSLQSHMAAKHSDNILKCEQWDFKERPLHLYIYLMISGIINNLTVTNYNTYYSH